MDEHEESLLTVLKRHWEAEIGFGIVCHEELPPDLRSSAYHLDFAFFGQYKALGFFTESNVAARRVKIILPVARHRQAIEDYKKLLQQLMEQCIVVSEHFPKVSGQEILTIEDAHERLFSAFAAERTTKPKTLELNFAAKHSVLVRDQRQIRSSLNIIRKLLLRRSAFWGDKESEFIADLLGSWSYELRASVGPESSLVANGTCRFVRVENTVRIIGTRENLVVSGKDNEPKYETAVPLTWHSEPLRFNTAVDGREHTVKFDGWVHELDEKWNTSCEFKFVANEREDEIRGKVKIERPESKAIEGQFTLSRGND